MLVNCVTMLHCSRKIRCSKTSTNVDIDQEDISDDDEGKNRSLSQDDADFYFGSKEDSVYGYRDRSQSDV